MVDATERQPAIRLKPIADSPCTSVECLGIGSRLIARIVAITRIADLITWQVDA